MEKADAEGFRVIRTFRPWQIFEHLNGNANLNIQIPKEPGTKTRTVYMLETALLVAAARIVNAKTILEIGTSHGYTALHLAKNTDADILTVDIEPLEQVWKGTEYESRITYNPARQVTLDHADMVFIDGGHDRENVKRDTEWAVSLNPKLIAWHDYLDPRQNELTVYIQEFAYDHDLIHVQDSRMAFWFKEDLR